MSDLSVNGTPVPNSVVQKAGTVAGNRAVRKWVKAHKGRGSVTKITSRILRASRRGFAKKRRSSRKGRKGSRRA